MTLTLRLAAAMGLVLAPLMAQPVSAQTELRIALQDEPDTLDPATNWSFVGRIVLQSMCDKLVDVDEQGTIVPMLATGWSWSADGRVLTFRLRDKVTFHDGTPFDAEAVKYNLDRALTMKESRRRSEIDVIAGMEVIDPLTLAISLKQPSVPLLAALSDRAGMMVSPKAGRELGAELTRKPVCAGPYRFVENKPQDRIVFEKFPQHWRAGDYAFDRLIFKGLPDSSVRLLNLRAGQFDIIDRLAPTDVGQVEKDATLAVHKATGLGYYNITFNIGNGTGANPAIAQNKLVRQAIDLAIDRKAINDVAFEGRFVAANQPFATGSTYFDPSRPVPARDVTAAKAKLKQAGLSDLTFTMLVPTDPQRQQVAQIAQAMLAEAGITLKVVSNELMSLLDAGRQGKFEAHLIGWSGRVDPDLNVTPLLSCKAAGNDGRYCNPALDELLAQARATADVAVRKALYAQVTATILDDAPVIYLYDPVWIFATTAKLKGFRAYPDGIIRLEGVTPSR